MTIKILTLLGRATGDHVRARTRAQHALLVKIYFWVWFVIDKFFWRFSLMYCPLYYAFLWEGRSFVHIRVHSIKVQSGEQKILMPHRILSAALLAACCIPGAKGLRVPSLTYRRTSTISVHSGHRAAAGGHGSGSGSATGSTAVLPTDGSAGIPVIPA